jgi:hypothetical protein
MITVMLFTLGVACILTANVAFLFAGVLLIIVGCVLARKDTGD